MYNTNDPDKVGRESLLAGLPFFLYINRQRKDVQPKYPRHFRFSGPRDPHPRVTNTSERREQFKGTAAFGFTGSF